MLKIDGWLFATFICHANVVICNNSSQDLATDISSSTSKTSITYTSNEISAKASPTVEYNETTTLRTTGVTTTTASTTIGTPMTTNLSLIEYTTTIGIGSIVVVAGVVLVAACYYRRTKARKGNRSSDKTNSRESVEITFNPNVRPSLEWDNPRSITVHSDANAVYATVQKMRPSQSKTLPTAYDIMISTMERVPDNRYNNKTELLDDTYDSTITYGKKTLDETYDHANFKTNYTTTDDIHDNTTCTHDNIYDLDAQQSTKEQANEYTHNNVHEEMNNRPFLPPIENVDDIYNNM
ncbi:hypothetical protein CHS0354_030233 [Potamilus streckersoni]|uniref:Uncharacterized protein n=1 Tax=Potamilus streckersoni TaxID=2493646 RepID=A0AAE0RSK9_9BIVA|nr:hypothetical protein CHS0354_030233 [Potamilus streckersoni]